jgi:hypothetical protein
MRENEKLVAAIKENKHEVIRSIIQDEKWPTENCETALQIAAEYGSLDTFRIVSRQIEIRLQDDIRSQLPLLGYAVRGGNVDKVAELLAVGCNRTVGNLREAVFKDDKEMVDLLLEKGGAFSGAKDFAALYDINGGSNYLVDKKQSLLNAVKEANKEGNIDKIKPFIDKGWTLLFLN